MTTTFLSDETIHAYLSDLVLRLDAMAHPPDVICSVTESGVELLTSLIGVIAQLQPKGLANPALASFGKGENDQIILHEFAESEIQGKCCLLIDSAVHTGRLMNRCRRKLLDLGAAEILSYALVTKRGSQHIATFWGLMIAEVDRALFSMRQIPNNRLASSDENSQQPVTLTLLDEDSLALSPVVTGVASMDRITWSDRLYDVKASAAEQFTRTYLMHKGAVAIGYLTVHMEPGRKSLVIDEVALDTAWHGKKLGGIFLRFACTLARHHDCKKVKLNAIANRVDFYEGYGFKKSPGRDPLTLDQETYHPMEKSILHEPEDGYDPEV